MSNSAEALHKTVATVVRVASSIAAVSLLSDDELLGAQEAYATLLRAAQPYGARVASEIARRSRHELGFEGLAKRKGFLDAHALIQSMTGGTRVEAAQLVTVGVMMAELADASAALATDGSIEPALAPWHAPIVEAVERGELSLASAHSIGLGLGSLDGVIAAESLTQSALALIADSPGASADRMQRNARALRDALDAEAIARREKERRELQYFSARRRADGMVVGSFAFADEDGALLLAAYDSATSPKRGGPRFVAAGERQRAEGVAADPRTPGQIAAEAIIGLLRIGIDADPQRILGGRLPAVRVIVSEVVLSERHGHGAIEGASDPVSLETVERHLCSSGIVGVLFDDAGQCVNVGRDQRTFTERQRVGMAVRDGGCRDPGCDRPPSWCEAHHIDYWARDGGRTDIADGILLCRTHHMLYHDNGWRIERDGGEYWLVPPPDVDPNRVRRPMPSKSAAICAMAAVRHAGA
ncbi:HNH endonuclease signature motif containing protein [Lacisediminihabitans sp.]|jgi:hypothetical protein|uniref:HNH endonuclease signature motif containing protein n=1 Tax=Lacisediminihabitans sp. TaxID=2787631 RepID=UPI002F92BC3E